MFCPCSRCTLIYGHVAHPLEHASCCLRRLELHPGISLLEQRLKCNATSLLMQSVTRAQGSGPSGDVAARIRAIHGDPAHPYNQSRHADHRRAVDEMAGLYARLSLPEAGFSDELDVAL